MPLQKISGLVQLKLFFFMFWYFNCHSSKESLGFVSFIIRREDFAAIMVLLKSRALTLPKITQLMGIKKEKLSIFVAVKCKYVILTGL